MWSNICKRFKLLVSKSSFDLNRANFDGGAISVAPGQSSAEIRDSLFNGNAANVGVVSLAVDVDSVIDNCTFTNNHNGATYGLNLLMMQL